MGVIDVEAPSALLAVSGAESNPVAMLFAAVAAMTRVPEALGGSEPAHDSGVTVDATPGADALVTADGETLKSEPASVLPLAPSSDM